MNMSLERNVCALGIRPGTTALVRVRRGEVEFSSDPAGMGPRTFKPEGTIHEGEEREFNGPTLLRAPEMAEFDFEPELELPEEPPPPENVDEFSSLIGGDSAH